MGIGPFAKRSYIPRLLALEANGQATLVAGVDLESNKCSVELYCKKTCFTVKLALMKPFTSIMPPSVEDELSEMVTVYGISCVIISTEPLAHQAYGLWALKLGLNIVMDKHITTRPMVNSSLEQATGIVDDYKELLVEYLAL